MPWPRQIVLVRHAQMTGNVLGSNHESLKHQGNHQFELTEEGVRQARLTGAHLHEQYGEFDAYFISTYRRTRDTLALMYPSVTPVVDSRLNELWRGIWHTHGGSYIETTFPYELGAQQRQGWYHYRPIGGQSGQDVEAGIYSYCADLREWHGGERVLIVTHNHWLVLFGRIWQQLPVEEVERRTVGHGYYPNASVTVYEPEGRRLRLIREGYAPYLTATAV